MEQKVSALTDDDHHQLTQQRDLVVQSVPEPSKHSFSTALAKIAAIQSILDADVFAPDETYQLQALGVVFGDALAEEYGYEWIIIEDEYGRDPALRVNLNDAESSKVRHLHSFPLTMISKRVEDGEEIDVLGLFYGIAEVIREQTEAAPD